MAYPDKLQRAVPREDSRFDFAHSENHFFEHPVMPVGLIADWTDSGLLVPQIAIARACVDKQETFDV